MKIHSNVYLTLIITASVLFACSVQDSNSNYLEELISIPHDKIDTIWTSQGKINYVILKDSLYQNSDIKIRNAEEIGKVNLSTFSSPYDLYRFSKVIDYDSLERPIKVRSSIHFYEVEANLMTGEYTLVESVIDSIIEL